MEEETNHTRKPLLLDSRGKFYDVALFADIHPGGRKVLDRLAGGNIDQYMEGRERIMGLKHVHSDAAYNILNRYALDSCHRTVDELLSGKPILSKVGLLGDRYWTWIHQPYDGTIRLFESNFLELLTRTSWWVIPIVWMPIVLYYTLPVVANLCLQYGVLFGLLYWMFFFGLGILTWSLLEYSLHRFAFHWQPNPESSNQILFHFLLHGLHHKTPMDGKRLVFPPLPAMPFVLLFYVFYRALFPYQIFASFAAGKLLGYIIYDLTHYYLHHGCPKPNGTMHYLKVYHYNHHFKDINRAFGISTIFWDHVFGTVGTGPN